MLLCCNGKSTGENTHGEPARRYQPVGSSFLPVTTGNPATFHPQLHSSSFTLSEKCSLFGKKKIIVAIYHKTVESVFTVSVKTGSV